MKRVDLIALIAKGRVSGVVVKPLSPILRAHPILVDKRVKTRIVMTS